MTAEPRPPFPPSAQSSGTIGAVVVRVLFDDEGKVIDRRVAAAVPGLWFQPAVESVLPRWRFERTKAAGEQCSLSGVWFVPIRFVFD
jgi:outer membrane biosynthesis protein TonB